ncbi:hypothetical protein ACTHGU_17610 [Chitinophagaceae bacterium MMS25-I14]
MMKRILKILLLTLPVNAICQGLSNYDIVDTIATGSKSFVLVGYSKDNDENIIIYHLPDHTDSFRKVLICATCNGSATSGTYGGHIKLKGNKVGFIQQTKTITDTITVQFINTAASYCFITRHYYNSGRTERYYPVKPILLRGFQEITTLLAQKAMRKKFRIIQLSGTSKKSGKHR